MGSTYYIISADGKYNAADVHNSTVASGNTFDECYNSLKRKIISDFKTEGTHENRREVTA